MRALGIIPARGGSKGIPGKNKKLLNGLPLIEYTLNAALQSQLTNVVISSDDDEIGEFALNKGVDFIKRPSELSTDTTGTLPVLHHVLTQVKGNYDYIVTLQPTSPFRTYIHINESLDLICKNVEADSLVSVVRVPHQFGPGSLMIKKGQWLLDASTDEKILRRQEKPVFYARNGAAIYITRRNKISDFIFGGNILAYNMDKISSIDIDDIEDWRMAEIIMFGLMNGKFQEAI